MVRTSLTAVCSLQEYSPKLPTIHSQMREVVAPQRVSSQYIYCLVENFLHEISKLRISPVSRCHRKFFVFLERRSTYSEQKDNATRQMVAYLGLTTME